MPAILAVSFIRCSAALCAPKVNVYSQLVQRRTAPLILLGSMAAALDMSSLKIGKLQSQSLTATATYDGLNAYLNFINKLSG
ncbi:MAG: hypothetical protein QME81_08295 [bacterium]|nr:hypothetical protein [bacterium]